MRVFLRGSLKLLIGHLSEVVSAELFALINEYPCLFGDVPSQTHLIERDNVGETQPIHQRFYRVSEDGQGGKEGDGQGDAVHA